MRPHGTLRIYGCGGFGINIATSFERAAGEFEHGYAEAFPTYIDTSRSNLRPEINPDRVFLLQDVDGSGKVRKENHTQIARTVKNIVQTHSPKDMNVVVFSASGGSGSVFGPLIAKELLERGETVVCIVVGSDESALTAANTRNTLKSLESIAGIVDAPVVMFYSQNEKDIPRSEIDAQCRQVISSICVLASANNDEMDSRDIANWTRFNRTTSVGARLVQFEVCFGNEDAERAIDPVAIASLYQSPDDAALKIEPEYHTAGYPRGVVKNFSNMHFVITLGDVPAIYKRMEEKITMQELQRAARVVHDKIVSDKDIVTGDGLVF